MAAVDSRKVALMRCLLAASGTLIVIIDPTEPNRLVGLTYLSLGLYTLYSALLYLLLLTRGDFSTAWQPWAHWVDIAWYILLVSLSDGTNSIFFFGFFFAILAASFLEGFAAGFSATLVSALSFALVGLATIPADTLFQLNRFLLRPTYLLIIGYMIAFWGGREIALKRRLALLKDVSTLANLRFGVDRTVSHLVERLSAFYSGSTCLLVIQDMATGTHRVYSAGDIPASDAMRESGGEALLSHMLGIRQGPQEEGTSLALPLDCAVVYQAKRGLLHFLLKNKHYWAINSVTEEEMALEQDRCEGLAEFLNANSFVSVPLHHAGLSGRLYLASRGYVFTQQDVHSALQVIEQVAPIIYNVRLVDRMASNAAGEERQRLARDVHDSVIQPYIGLQMALAATRDKLATRGNPGADDLDTVLRLSSAGIADLRSFIRNLSQDRGHNSNALLPAARSFIRNYSEATGTEVELRAPEGLIVNDRLAAELLQIIAEGLSNIRKHTTARKATITMSNLGESMRVCIENEQNEASHWREFVPHSITNRASDLGGRTTVQRTMHGTTAVTIDIPL